MADVAQDRDALYYPYIHITDANWLKATLLCFPRVRRMVPGGFVPSDGEVVRAFSELRGPGGRPLLDPVDLFSPRAEEADRDLLAKLQENDDLIRSKYSKSKTIAQFGKNRWFLLHDEKIIRQLYTYLTSGTEDNALAWRTDPPKNRPQRDLGVWLALHPTLGSAILSTKAVAIAEDQGLDIVTDSDAAHHTVVARKEGEIFDYLTGRRSSASAPNTADTVDDLAEVVISTNFDVSKLTPRQVADLKGDGKDLRRFKDALVPFASRIPPIANPQERRRRLNEAASEVVDEWERYKNSLPRFAVEAIFESTEVKWPDLANSLTAGACTVSRIGLAAGLGVTLVTYAGVKVWRAYKERVSSPYSYLSRIAKAERRSQSFLVLPPIV